MASELGKFIRRKRTELDIGLRELARRIEKSAPFLTQLETDNDPPPASEETLRSIARELDVSVDELFALAQKLPQDLAPETALEVAMYRKVKGMPPDEQRRFLDGKQTPRRRK
jgi:transcriptional regulator with XRE-family HTH domain